MLMAVFPLKPGSVGTPTKLYLGGKLLKVEFPNGVIAWTISASRYIHQVIRNLEPILAIHGLKLRRNTNSPLPGNYHHERDATPECGTANVRLYA